MTPFGYHVGVIEYVKSIGVAVDFFRSTLRNRLPKTGPRFYLETRRRQLFQK